MVPFTLIFYDIICSSYIAASDNSISFFNFYTQSSAYFVNILNSSFYPISFLSLSSLPFVPIFLVEHFSLYTYLPMPPSNFSSTYKMYNYDNNNTMAVDISTFVIDTRRGHTKEFSLAVYTLYCTEIHCKFMHILKIVYFFILFTLLNIIF